MKSKFLVFIVAFLCFSQNIKAQMTTGITGLLHMPSAEMQRDGTFMIGGNFLNKHNLPNDTWWGYNTYNYFINITFFSRLEISYICTLVKGQKELSYWPESTWGRFTNQDRHFSGRIQILKEGEFWKIMPSVVIGVNDPTTGAGSDYSEFGTKGSGNGYFNKWYVALSKNFELKGYGNMGFHFAYLYNQRSDYTLNGPAFGINFRPEFHPNLNLIAEYDAKTLNIGAIYSMWGDHFNLLLEMQRCKYLSVGLVYKVCLKGGNQWKKRIFER